MIEKLKRHEIYLPEAFFAAHCSGIFTLPSLQRMSRPYWSFLDMEFYSNNEIYV
jgi:hypothetical protein